MDENNLGVRIRDARKKAGLSQKELARRLEITMNTVNRYEKCHRLPDANVLTRLVEVLKCDPAWLLTGIREAEETEEDTIRRRGLVEGWSKEDIEDFKKWKKEKPLTVCDERAIYNVSDPELAEIVAWLKEHPRDKKLVSKLIKGRKFTEEAVEGFGIENKLKEEG